MRKPIYSLSGHEMTMSDAERVLCILSDVKARALMSDADGNKVVGHENAHIIRDALREQGFEIVHNDQR